MLNLALASALLAAVPEVGLPQRGKSGGLDLRLLMNAPSAVAPVGVSSAVRQVKLLLEWKGQLCTEPGHVADYWSGESLGRHEGSFTIQDMPAHSARLLVCKG